MVNDLVFEVRKETGKPRLAVATNTKTKKTSIKSKSANKGLDGTECPKCSKGKVLKGKTSYGCNQWKEGCDFRIPFVFMDKKLTDKQVQRLIEKKETTKIKGFVLNGEKVEGILKLNALFEIEFENKMNAVPKNEISMPACPKCKKGTIIKGKTAYGCSRWKEGCDFRFFFKDIKSKANGQALTKELVLKIISS